jgi:hypothetical protein
LTNKPHLLPIINDTVKEKGDCTMRYSIQEMKNSGFTYYEIMDTANHCRVVFTTKDYCQAAAKQQELEDRSKEPQDLYATVTIRLTTREGESYEAACDRLYEFLYDSLCNAADHNCDFWIEDTHYEDD